MSVDGRIDDTSPERLRLSNEADFDEIDELRAGCDAILVGAGTLRADNPRLLVRSQWRRRRRADEGRTEHPVKVVVTQSGRLDPDARLFTTGDADKIVYTSAEGRAEAADRLSGVPGVTLVEAGGLVDPAWILADLAERGVRRLLVEGGGHMHTLFLTAGLADELRLAVAPFFIGDAAAPGFVRPGVFAHTPDNPMRLVETRSIGDIAVLRYLLDEKPA